MWELSCCSVVSLSCDGPKSFFPQLFAPGKVQGDRKKDYGWPEMAEQAVLSMSVLGTLQDDKDKEIPDQANKNAILRIGQFAHNYFRYVVLPRLITGHPLKLCARDTCTAGPQSIGSPQSIGPPSSEICSPTSPANAKIPTVTDTIFGSVTDIIGVVQYSNGETIETSIQDVFPSPAASPLPLLINLVLELTELKEVSAETEWTTKVKFRIEPPGRLVWLVVWSFGSGNLELLDRLPGTPANTYFLVLEIFAEDELIPKVRHLLVRFSTARERPALGERGLHSERRPGGYR